MQKTIEVTREDLKADYGEPHTCPIAMALKRTFKTNEVLVYCHRTLIDNKIYDLPKEADEKAHNRSRSIAGWLLGGFKFNIEI